MDMTELSKDIMACEAMVDIETLDTTETAVIFQVAVVLFDADHTPIFSRQINLEIQEQINAGRTISESTLTFHLNIPDNLQRSLNDPSVMDLDYFHSFLASTFFTQKYNIEAWWSKGDFDFKLLENLIASSKHPMQLPWSFRNKRELRTLMKECGVPKGTVVHNALADCHAQIAQLAECRKRIHA